MPLMMIFAYYMNAVMDESLSSAVNWSMMCPMSWPSKRNSWTVNEVWLEQYQQHDVPKYIRWQKTAYPWWYIRKCLIKHWILGTFCGRAWFLFFTYLYVVFLWSLTCWIHMCRIWSCVKLLFSALFQVCWWKLG